MSVALSRVVKAMKHLRTDDMFAVHQFDRDTLREVLIRCACPIVCVGQRQRDGGPDWHEWCERKADAALAILESVDPPVAAPKGGSDG